MCRPVAGGRPVDAMLDELRTRIDTMREAPDGLHSLLRALLSAGRDTNLPEVLEQVTEAAAELVDAEYGAFGVLDADRTLTRSVTVGVGEDELRGPGPLPPGPRLLRDLIRNPEARPLSEPTRRPAACGLPDQESPAFLGVPVRVRGEVFGNLYLTGRNGDGGFDEQDEAAVSVLAVAAGVAVDNARLYEEAGQRQRWVGVTAEITRRLLSGTGDFPVLELLVERARDILTADLGVIALPKPYKNQAAAGDTGPKTLRVALALGRGTEVEAHPVFPVDGSLMGQALITQRPATAPAIAPDPLTEAGPRRWSELGPTVAVPLGTGGAVRGALLFARVRGAPMFTRDEVVQLVRYTGQAALAVELAERRRDAEQLAVFEDRERIARDLHDLAIQRLFATGLTLQSTLPLVGNEEAGERLSRVVDELDESIKTIRSAIFGLRTQGAGPLRLGLRARTAQSVEESAELLGFTPTLEIQGLIDTDVPNDMADAALAVLGEALANIARHARADAASVVMKAGSDEFSVTVADDGVGPVEETGRSGLRNLEERAEGFGGGLDLSAGPAGGTRLVWRVPLEAA